MEGLLRRHGRGKFGEVDDLFEYLAESLAYADGGFGGRLNEQTLVLSRDCCAFGCGDLL